MTVNNKWSDLDKRSLGNYLRWNSYCSERYRLLYVATPKVACTTFKWWFAALEGYSDKLQKVMDSRESDPELIIHDSHKVAPNITGLTLSELSEALTSDSYFRFAVVRNPYKRIFSAWQSKLLLKEPLQAKPYVNSDFYNHPIKTVADIAMAFECFLEHLLAKEAPSYWDHHWAPQASLIRPDLISYSQLTKIEECEKIGQALVSWLGIGIPNPFENRRANESLIPFFSELLTDRSAYLIRILYAQDFDTFEYHTSLPKNQEEFSRDQCEVAIKAIKLIRARHIRLAESYTQIDSLNQSFSEREYQIESMNQAVSERDKQIESMNQAVSECDKQIESLNQTVSERDKLIESLNHDLFDLNKQILDYKKRLSIREYEINEILTSNSWRLTAHLRNISNFKSRYLSLAKENVINYFAFSKNKYIQLKILYSTVPKAISFYQGSIPLTIRRVSGVLKREGVSGVIRRSKILTQQMPLSDRFQSIALYGNINLLNDDFRPLVSIIVPNFNHAPFLKARLDSIYQQTYTNYEVILLDDRSSDHSLAILKDYAVRYKDKTSYIFNKKNSGGVFNQWRKGLELARGELIWIAESDDYCASSFLEEMVPCFQNKGVKLAFGNTDFVNSSSPPEIIWTLSQYLQGFGTLCWNNSFIKSAHALVKAGWAEKNIIPNVSSAVFRQPEYLDIFDELEWLKMRLCGDWVFYLTFIRGGLVAYNPRAINYYRQHNSNTSVNAQKDDIYYREFEIVAKRIFSLYAIHLNDLKKQEQSLYNHWCSQRGEGRLNEFRQLYDLERCIRGDKERRPNILMAVYALSSGGGETFPIMLANGLALKGYSVTLLNCQQQKTEPGVLEMISPLVSLLELDRLDSVANVCDDMAISLVHSHHAWVDMTLAMLLTTRPNIKHVVSTHGMYEMMTKEQIDSLMPLLRNQIDIFVYTAEKNLKNLPPDLLRERSFRRIDNALPPKSINPILRHEFGLGEDDFVLCLVSRAIPEKGWAEAIEAVKRANKNSRRKIQLLMIGEGPEFDRILKLESNPNIHLLGFRYNIRDYFATADLGFLPTRFKGESAPLVLIDCLLAGKPMIASDVGEIRYMLKTSNGVAGALFQLEEWNINIETLSELIVDLANNNEIYLNLLASVPEAAAKFEFKAMIEKYEEVYREVLSLD